MTSLEETTFVERSDGIGTRSPHDDNTSGGSVYSIGDLAKEFGVTLRTLRFYESKCLLTPRREGVARVYTEEDRYRLGLILQGKRLGFTLTEIRALIASQGNGHDRRGQEDGGVTPPLRLSRQQCVEQIRMLERQKREVEDAIGELRRTYNSLYQGFSFDLARPA
jgi:DNA-binding transcriptional MerR regulator